MRTTAHPERLAIVLSLALAAGGSAVASEIYKWTDADGNVHYGDRPVEGAERLAITSRPTNPERISAQMQARTESRALADEEAAGDPDGPTEEELRAEARERAEKCDMYKARLTKFVQSRRLYREDENGERVYLDEEETQDARERVQDRVEEYCNS